MSTYILKCRQYIPCSLEEAWGFFSTPRNLEAITPDSVGFKILSIEKDIEAYAGQIIQYSIQIFGMKLRWITEITQVQKEKMFIDEQRFGPYTFWHHQHHFIKHDDGCLMEDIVHYKLPFGFLGKLGYYIFIKKHLQHIFHYRRQAVEKKWGKSQNFTITTIKK